MDYHLRKLERKAKSGDPAAQLRLEYLRRRVHATPSYRPCSVCPASVSPSGVYHPLYVGPAVGVGPIAAISYKGFWIEFCIEEITALGGWESLNEGALHELADEILNNG